VTVQGLLASLVVDRDRVGEDHGIHPVLLRCVGDRQAGEDSEDGVLRQVRLGCLS
jgi:hypothetical protein